MDGPAGLGAIAYVREQMFRSFSRIFAALYPGRSLLRTS
jgi:hypothetical protein